MGKILISGGTGFAGKKLIAFLSQKGYSLNVLTRKKHEDNHQNIQYYNWDIEKQYIDKDAFIGVDTIINLAGANISEKRWTSKRKSEILESRIRSLDLIYKYVKQNNFKIDTLISSSAVGYYGSITSDDIFTEKSNNGNDFLAAVCKQWERTALQLESLGIRTVILRKGIIIGKDGGMYKKTAPLAKLGINTALGKGNQYFPWIDIRDLVRLYEFILKTKEINGIFNAVSSEHITMNDFSKALLLSFGKKSLLPNVPLFIVKLLFGEMSVILTEGSRVSNEKLKQTGFALEFDTIDKSLSNQL